jgi:hypothetical protein
MPTEHWLLRIVSRQQVSLQPLKIMIGTSYQEQIVLDHVVLEIIDRKRSVCHLLYEFMLSILFPWFLDIFAVEKVGDEAAAVNCQKRFAPWL